MLSSGLRKVMKALLILLAAPLITADANASSEVSTAASVPNAVSSRANPLLGERSVHIG